MRDVNLTDQQQVDLIKQWWHDYGKYLAVAVILGILLSVGWRTWQQHSLQKSLAASSLYQQLLVADAKQDTGSVEQIAKSLMRYPHSAYASMAKLILAKEALQNKNLALGLTRLQWVIAHSKNTSFRQIARIRAARVLLTQNQPQSALQLLATIDDDTFQPEINAIKGDIYVASGENDKAKAAYTLAQQQFTANGVGDNIMQLKLAAPLPATAAPNP